MKSLVWANEAWEKGGDNKKTEESSKHNGIPAIGGLGEGFDEEDVKGCQAFG